MKTYAKITGYWTSNPEELHTTLVCTGEWTGEDDPDVFYYMDGSRLTEGDTLDVNVQDDAFIVKSIISVFTR